KYRLWMGTPTGIRDPTPPERLASSQYESAAQSIADMRAIAARNPGAAKQAVTASKASRWGRLGTLITEARGTLTDPDAQTFFTQYANMLLAEIGRASCRERV